MFDFNIQFKKQGQVDQLRMYMGMITGSEHNALYIMKHCENAVKNDSAKSLKMLELVNELLSNRVSIETVLSVITKIKEMDFMPTRYGSLFNGVFELSMERDRRESLFDKESIKKVIFKDPATIVLWKDGTKTVVKCQKKKGDTYNPELGLAMCIIKKMCGNKGNYNDVFNKWLSVNV